MSPTDGGSAPAGRTAFDVLFRNRRTLSFLVVALLVAISTLPNLGVVIGWAFLLVALAVGFRQSSLAEIGFRRPADWRRTLLRGLGVGVGLQLAFSIVVEPLLGRLTGRPVDVSAFDGMRGDLANYLVMLAFGWLIGGFLEEMLFRGYLLERLRIVLGDGGAATAAAVLLPAVAFGLSHSYQDVPGMISTGLFGVFVGLTFLWSRGNLWLPILVHGVYNTVGITLIYTNGDRVLNHLLFP